MVYLLLLLQNLYVSSHTPQLQLSSHWVNVSDVGNKNKHYWMCRYCFSLGMNLWDQTLQGQSDSSTEESMLQVKDKKWWEEGEGASPQPSTQCTTAVNRCKVAMTATLSMCACRIRQWYKCTHALKHQQSLPTHPPHTWLKHISPPQKAS